MTQDRVARPGQLEPLTLVIEAARLALELERLALRHTDERLEDAACEDFEYFATVTPR